MASTTPRTCNPWVRECRTDDNDGVQPLGVGVSDCCIPRRVNPLGVGVSVSNRLAEVYD